MNVLLVGVPTFYREDVQIDGHDIPDEKSINASSIAFRLPSRGRMRNLANRTFRLTPECVYVLMYESYNAMSSPSVTKAEGVEEIYSYGDGHGMRWSALYKVVADQWRIDWNTPGHHSHGFNKHRAVGTRSGFERSDNERELEEAKQV